MDLTNPFLPISNKVVERVKQIIIVCQKSLFLDKKSPLAPLTRVGFLELLPQMEFAKWTIGCFFEFWTHLHSRRAKNLPLRALAPLNKGGIQEVPLNKGDLGGFASRNSTSSEFANVRQKFIWISIIGGNHE